MASLFVISLGAQTRTLSDFSKIDLSGSITATLVQSNESKIDIKMIKGSEESLITEVSGGKLTVKFKKGFMNWNNNKKAEVTIYYAKLNEIDASAGSAVKSDDVITGNALTFDVSSGANMQLSVEGDMVNIDASSGASITCVANKSIEAEASSGGSIKYIGEPTKQNIDVGKYSGGSVTQM